MISGLVREALEERISSELAAEPEEVFYAYEGGRRVAQARSLDELGQRLREQGISPRSVRVESSIPREEAAWTGLRRVEE